MPEDSLTILAQHVVAGTLCPRLIAHARKMAELKRRAYRDWEYWGKPVPPFGDPRARLLVVGLAPAAHGGNRTGRMFTGDSSGNWLFAALHRFGFANQAISTHRAHGMPLRACCITVATLNTPPANKPASS